MAISLKIKGNKRANEGVGIDLVAIGDPRFPVLDAQYPGVGQVTDFIILRHLPDKSVYTLATTNVTPCDSSRPGTLLVSVAVPAGETVDDLFGLLVELSNLYKAEHMTYDGANYHFTANPDSPEHFAAILAAHAVRPYPYRPVLSAADLSSVAYIYMTPQDIRDVLSDPMRPEFARFGQVVFVPVAEGAANVPPSTVDIPARVSRAYRVTVNGHESRQTYSDPNQPISITLPETPTHLSASITFTIAEARAKGVKGVKVDDLRQVIDVNLQPARRPLPPPSQTSARRSSGGQTMWLWIAVGVLSLAVIGLLVWIFFLSSDDEKNEGAEIVSEEIVEEMPPFTLTNPNDTVYFQDENYDTFLMLYDESYLNRDSLDCLNMLLDNIHSADTIIAKHPELRKAYRDSVKIWEARLYQLVDNMIVNGSINRDLDEKNGDGEDYEPDDDLEADPAAKAGGITADKADPADSKVEPAVGKSKDKGKDKNPLR